MNTPSSKSILLVIFVLIQLWISGCSLNKVVVRSTASVLEKGMNALFHESDLIIAETSLISQLKLLESLLESDPSNETILVMLAQGYYTYAMGFVEDTDPERAKMLYVRGRNYARTILQQQNRFWSSATGSTDDFERALEKINEPMLVALFWNAMNWGNWIMLSLDNPQALFDLAKVERMMERVLLLDERFFFAGPHIFFGCLYAARPVMLGGKPGLALEHFERARQLNNRNIKLVDFYIARFYAVQMLDRHMFENILTEILEFDVSSVPNVALVNQLARKKAEFWLNKKEVLF